MKSKIATCIVWMVGYFFWIWNTIIAIRSEYINHWFLMVSIPMAALSLFGAVAVLLAILEDKE